MKTLSVLLTLLGLTLALVGNALSYYATSSAISAMTRAETSGIAVVAWAVPFSHTCSLVGLLGCIMLLVGVITGFLARPK
jgi:hypothetical protein